MASESTLYRVLRQTGQAGHRRTSRPATATRPRERVATGPNPVHSWDVTLMPAPVRGTFLYLCLFTDVWSRMIVAAEVHLEESAAVAAGFFVRACQAQGLAFRGLTLHSDNGSPMKGETMLAALRRLGVISSFSRPHVRDDNPHSEALFRALKYRPSYPASPSPRGAPRRLASTASSVGTTRSTAIVSSASSTGSSVTTVTTAGCWHDDANSTRNLVPHTPSGGPALHATGPPSQPSPSTPRDGSRPKHRDHSGRRLP